MLINELPYEEQLKLTRIAGACLALEDRLKNHFFKVLKFQVTVASDMIIGCGIRQISGIEASVTVDGTLPAGAINVAALVQ